MKGFTIVEILVVVAIFGVLLGSSVVMLSSLRLGPDLESEARALQRVFELARSRTIASEGDAKYGVYIDVGTSPQQYVLFQGNDYASRQVSEDEVYKLRETVEFGSVSFGGGSEATFERIEGIPNNTGSALLRLTASPSNTKTVYVVDSGAVEIDSSSIPSDNDRVVDTRHVHIDYGGREIDLITETIVLNFDSGAKIETVIIADYLSGGQIVWGGTVTVGGEDQALRIRTYKLNEGAGYDTQFSVHRDLRWNTKPLLITVSGDGTGKLIEYDGVPSNGELLLGGESLYVTGIQTQ